MLKKSFVENMTTGFIDKFVENASTVNKIDNKILAEDVITSLKSNLDALEDVLPDVEVQTNVSSWDIYKLAKDISEDRPTDASMKFVLGKCRDLWEVTQGQELAVEDYSDMQRTCAQMFNSTSYYQDSFFNNDIPRLSAQNSLDVDFLSKAASLIHTAEDFDAALSELEYKDDDFYSVEARNFIYSEVAKRLGDSAEFTEIEADSDDYGDILKKDKGADSLSVHSDEWRELKTPEKKYDRYTGEYVEIEDLSLRSFDDADGVRQVRWVQSQQEKGWRCYVVTAEEGTEGDVVLVATNMRIQDAADSISDRIGEAVSLESYDLKKKAEEPEDVAEDVDYTLKPEVKAPSKVEKGEVIERLTGQAKEAITKLWNRSQGLREIKEIQVVKQGELTDLRNQLKQESDVASEELTGYMGMLDKAMQKQNLVLQTAYAIKQDEEDILVAIKESVQAVPAAGQEPLKYKDAESILVLLKDMGHVTDEMVKAAEKSVDDFNESIKMVTKITRTVHTFPPTQKDVIESSTAKTALDLGTIKQWAGNIITKAKDFFGVADEAASEMVDDYKELQGLVKGVTASKTAEDGEDPLKDTLETLMKVQEEDYEDYSERWMIPSEDIAEKIEALLGDRYEFHAESWGEGFSEDEKKHWITWTPANPEEIDDYFTFSFPEEVAEGAANIQLRSNETGELTNQVPVKISPEAPYIDDTELQKALEELNVI